MTIINWPLWVIANGLISPEVKHPHFKATGTSEALKIKSTVSNYLKSEDPVSYKHLYDVNRWWHFFVMKKKNNVNHRLLPKLLFFSLNLSRKKKEKKCKWLDSIIDSFSLFTHDFSKPNHSICCNTMTTVSPFYSFQLEEKNVNIIFCVLSDKFRKLKTLYF